jgi:hypothetical protein
MPAQPLDATPSDKLFLFIGGVYDRRKTDSAFSGAEDRDMAPLEGGRVVCARLGAPLARTMAPFSFFYRNAEGSFRPFAAARYQRSRWPNGKTSHEALLRFVDS